MSASLSKESYINKDHNIHKERRNKYIEKENKGKKEQAEI